MIDVNRGQVDAGSRMIPPPASTPPPPPAATVDEPRCRSSWYTDGGYPAITWRDCEIRCNLPAGHDGNHDELVDGQAGILTWPPRQVEPDAHDRMKRQLAEVTRERDEARRDRDWLTAWPYWRARVDRVEAEREAMRPVVEAAQALRAVDATRAEASDNCSAWLATHAYAVAVVLAAVERYERPAVTWQPAKLGDART